MLSLLQISKNSSTLKNYSITNFPQKIDAGGTRKRGVLGCACRRSRTPSCGEYSFYFFYFFIYFEYIIYIIPIDQWEGIHGTSLVIEDAEILGALLSKVESRSQISQLMMAYEDIRHPRCAQIYQHHWLLDTVFKMSVGPEQELRDSVYRRTLVQKDWDVFDESGLQASLGDLLTSFAYDATEAVEDWRASSRGENTPFRRSPLKIWITQE